MSPTARTSFLNWSPVLKPEEVFQDAVQFSFPEVDEMGRAFWIESRPAEKGRSVVVQRDRDGKIRDLTPKKYSVRSRVFEYGAQPYTVFRAWVYFVNQEDQRIYKQDLTDLRNITPVTVETNDNGTIGKYAELAVSPDGKWLAAAYEVEAKKGENPNYLVVIPTGDYKPVKPKIIARGASFYRSPKFSLDGRMLAWLEWNHPYMSWNSTLLKLALFDDGKVTQVHQMAGSETESISCIGWGPRVTLYASVDKKGCDENSPDNFYNIKVVYPPDRPPVTQALVDYPSFRVTGQMIAAVRVEKGQSSAVLIDTRNGKETQIAKEYAEVSQPLMTTLGDTFLIGSPDDRPAEVVTWSMSGEKQVHRRASGFEVNPADVSRPELICFPTADGRQAYGYFYPPKKQMYAGLHGEKPPVRVLMHGGPVAATSRAFTLAKLFWTSQGYAIFDVNYRGSTGFGRAYRDAIEHKWGLIEVQDVKDGLAFLRKEGRIGDQAVVSGGSAGGYSVQRLLTFEPELFAAGASYYGIGNLVTLQKLTHKFEAHYLEQLIGGTLDENEAEYRARSPINHLDRLKAPMVIFQGKEDKVVPPENSREMARILYDKRIPHEYHEYLNEGHGFRRRENLVDSLTVEAKFFRTVLTSHER